MAIYPAACNGLLFFSIDAERRKVKDLPAGGETRVPHGGTSPDSGGLKEVWEES
jgi:hypothetical protein